MGSDPKNLYQRRITSRKGLFWSSILFITILDDVKETKTETKQIFIGHEKQETVSVAECAFANDLVALRRTEAS